MSKTMPLLMFGDEPGCSCRVCGQRCVVLGGQYTPAGETTEERLDDIVCCACYLAGQAVMASWRPGTDKEPE